MFSLSFEKEYCNWQGKITKRKFVPLWLYFGSTQYYKKPQWLLFSWDVKKNAFRIFAMLNFI